MDDSAVFTNLMRSTVCKGCDGVKVLRQSFCRNCYFRLPKILRNGLSQHKPGYPSHFRVCLSWLREHAHERKAS